MSQHSEIQWTDATWNPVAGCSKISPGCARCYAVKESRRMGSNPHPGVQAVHGGLVHKLGNGLLDWTGELRPIPDRLEIPLHWKKPRRIFVNSLSDLFHDAVPEEFIHQVFDVMVRARQHQFQVLTKRADRLKAIAPRLPWADNIWQGVSVENADYTFRIDRLRDTAAKTKFLSVEPLLGPIPNLDLRGIDWVIIGGESGPGARPMLEEWVVDIREQCDVAGTAFFFKQWGGRNKKSAGRKLQGRTYDAMPANVSERRVTLDVV